jgi:CheY-like chemotaxis protein
MHASDHWTRRRAVILLVDDDPGDRELTRRALEDDALRVQLCTVNDGQEALDYLLRRNQFADPAVSPRPDVILLDLNMPRMNGRRVLEKLRENPDLDRIPVIVLTTSSHEEDIVRSYSLGCNSFISKPVEIGPFMQAVRKLGDYWFELVALPHGVETCPV